MPNETPQGSRDMSALYMPAAIVVAGLLIAIGLFFGLSKTGGSAPQGSGNQPQQQAVDIKNVNADGRPYIGKENAPVVMAYWSDYQCPWCKKFETEVLPTLITKYVDTGKLKIVFKDYPFLGEDSTTAALYAHAMWELYPSKYFAWREAMYKAQDAEGDQGFGDEATILTLTKTISGVDTVKLKTQVASKKDEYQQKITADQQEGASMGVSGTPGFITGTTFIGGYKDLPEFTQDIDAQL